MNEQMTPVEKVISGIAISGTVTIGAMVSVVLVAGTCGRTMGGTRTARLQWQQHHAAMQAEAAAQTAKDRRGDREGG